MEYALRDERTLLTIDSDFADIRNYPPGTHKGVIRFKVKFTPSDVIVNCFKKLIVHIDSRILAAGGIVITDCKKYRIKTPYYSLFCSKKSRQIPQRKGTAPFHPERV